MGKRLRGMRIEAGVAWEEAYQKSEESTTLPLSTYPLPPLSDAVAVFADLLGVQQGFIGALN